MTKTDDILILAGRRAAGARLSAADQTRLETALLEDPDLALLILDAAEVAAQSRPQVRRMGRLTLSTLIMGLLACFGLGATAGAQLATGFVEQNSGRGSSGEHQIEVRAIGDALSLSLSAARKKG